MPGIISEFECTCTIHSTGLLSNMYIFVVVKSFICVAVVMRVRVRVVTRSLPVPLMGLLHWLWFPVPSRTSSVTSHLAAMGTATALPAAITSGVPVQAAQLLVLPPMLTRHDVATSSGRTTVGVAVVSGPRLKIAAMTRRPALLSPVPVHRAAQPWTVVISAIIASILVSGVAVFRRGWVGAVVVVEGVPTNDGKGRPGRYPVGGGSTAGEVT